MEEDAEGRSQGGTAANVAFGHAGFGFDSDPVARFDLVPADLGDHENERPIHLIEAVIRASRDRWDRTQFDGDVRRRGASRREQLRMFTLLRTRSPKTA